MCRNSEAPLFHVVPPTHQKIYQSEAYIRYIESLNRDSASMCDWTRELSASQDLVGPYCLEDDIQIPAWLDRMILKDKDPNSSSSTDSLFALRDFLLQESLSVVKFA